MAERTALWRIVANFGQARREAKQLAGDLDSIEKSQHRLNTTNAEANRVDSDRQRRVSVLVGATKSLADIQKRAAEGNQRASAALRVMANEERALFDARTRLQGATLASQRAELGLEAARNRLNQVSQSSRSTALQLQRAHLGVAEAELRVETAHNRVARAERELVSAQKKVAQGAGGISGAFKDLKKDFDGVGQSARRFVSFLRLLKLPAIIVGVAGLASAMSALLGGVTAVVSALGPLVGLLGALPGAFALAGQAAGTLFLGFIGVANALKSYTKQQKAAIKEGSSAAKTEVSNARRVRDAQRSLRDAREAQTKAAQDAADNISSAEQKIVEAQRNAVQAQQNLNKARDEARQNLRDLQNQLQDLALDEKGASLSVEQARADLIRTLNDPGSTDLERRSAALAVQEAEQRLKEVREQAADTGKALADAQQKGVENSDQVVQAKEDEVQANQEVVQAQKDLSKTVRESSIAQRDAAEGVQRAMEDLADAQTKQADAASGGSAANLEFADAMKKLTPEGRAFVKQLISMQPLLDKLRATAERGLLPGVTDALKRSTSLFPIFNQGVKDTSQALGDTARSAGKLVTSGPFKKDFATILKENAGLTRIFGNTALNLADALRNIVISAIPLVHWLALTAEGFSKTIKANAQAGRDSGRTAAFFEKTRTTLQKLFTIFGNLAKGFLGIGKAAFGAGQSMLDTFIKVTKKFSDFTNSTKGQNTLKKYFEDIRPALGEIARIFGVLGKGFLLSGADPSTAKFLKQIREQLLPALATLVNNIKGEFSQTIVDLITNLTKVFADLSAAGGGLATFAKVFNFFIGAVGTALDKVPGLAIALGVLVASLGALRGIKLATQITGLSALGKQIARIGEATAGKDAGGPKKFAAGLKVMRSGLVGFVKDLGVQAKKAGPLFARIGNGAAQVAVMAAQGFGKLGKVVVSALKGLRVLLLANPWILIIAGLIVAVILIIKYWDQIKKVVSIAINFLVDFVKKHWPILLIILTGGLGAVVVLIIKHWDSIKRAFTVAINAIISFVKKVWNGIKTYLIQPLVDFAGFVKKVWSTIGSAFNTAISSVVSLVKRVWGAVYNTLINPIKEAFGWIAKEFGKFKSVLGSAASIAVSAFSKAWDAIKTGFSKPVEFIVNTVIDDWILGTLNKVLSFLHLPNIPLVPKIGGSSSKSSSGAGGGGGNSRPVARNTGGFIPGTGNRDSVPALLTPGEFVLRKSAAQALGAERLRQLNRTGTAHFAEGGGVFSSAGGAVDTTVAGAQIVGGVIKDIGGKAIDLAREGAAKGLEQAFKPIRALMNAALPDSGWGAIPKGFVNSLMDKTLSFVSGQEDAIFSKFTTDLPLGNAVTRWAPTVAEALRLLRQPLTLVPSVLELIRHESGGNPNAINLTDSNAKRGDPSRGLMQTIGSTFRAYAGQFLPRGIFDPLANIFAGLNYGIHRYGSVMNIPGINSIAHGGPYKPYAVGGGVPGSGNRDSVPAMLTPGEFVIRKSAAKRLGMANLHALNSVQYFHAGGPVRGVVRKQSKGNWVNSLFLNEGSINRFPGAWDLDLDARLSKSYPNVPPPIASADLRTLVASLNISRTRGGAGIGEIQNRYKWGLQKLLTLLSVGRQYIGAHVPYAKRSRIYGEYNSWVNKAHAWNSDLDRVLGLPQDGRFGPDDVAPLKHVLDHAFGKPHDKFAPRPWGPLDAAEVAEQEQLRANALQQEFNGYLSLFASWGLNDLVQKLYDMGPADGMEIARAAAKNRSQATALNTAYAQSNALNNPNTLDALKLVGYISSWNGAPGLRDLAMKLQVPDYAVVQLYDSVKDQVAKAVSPDKLTKLLQDIELFRQGLFYAAGGGKVPGTGSGDTVPAMLTPGEFVLRKNAVRALGMQNVMALNRFAEGGPVGLGMKGPSLPQLAASVSAISSRGGTYVEHADQVSNNWTYNTNIYNPTGENSVASMNRNLKRQARLGVARPGQASE